MALRRRKNERGHQLFAGFSDVQEIGVGSLATVYQAREIGTSRLVALKLLNVRDASPRAIESFERESLALGALSSHPNIVTLYRTFRTPDGRPVLVLELCSGAVADRLHGGAGLPVPDAVAIGIKVAGALETAHRGGILHRDVKPQNILVTEFGEPALADFGVAMLQSSTQTTAGLFDFTTLHAAPELLEGQGTSAATDVYELASSLYQLIAGQSAFRAYEGEAPASVILRILRDPVRPLSGAEVPVQLSDLLIRAMDKDKENRPPTAAEFAAELAEVEKAQGWPRTQFLIRDAAGAGLGSRVTRLPDDVPRGLPSTLGAVPPAAAAPAAPVAPVVAQAAPPPPAVWAPPPAAPPPAAPPPTETDVIAREPAGRWTLPPPPVAEPVAVQPEFQLEPADLPSTEVVPPQVEALVPVEEIDPDDAQPEVVVPPSPAEPEPAVFAVARPVPIAEERTEAEVEVEPLQTVQVPPPFDEHESHWEPSAPAVVSWWAPLRTGEASADEFPIAPQPVARPRRRRPPTRSRCTRRTRARPTGRPGPASTRTGPPATSSSTRSRCGRS